MSVMSDPPLVDRRGDISRALSRHTKIEYEMSYRRFGSLQKLVTSPREIGLHSQEVSSCFKKEETHYDYGLQKEL